ncbi:MAG: aminotransferase class I/II-fold pyridoxal phosphate-dependent enzyme [Candidatus Delongbacteria bacterium]|nr:aminotransferase class I/II-fold pyridoxal phosphate-dependent enzyme [Candidatus Delongbacteria bacterium]
MKSKIFLSCPHMSGNEIKYIYEAFDQNWIAPLGPNVDAFEDALADYCGVKHVAALVSGTAAIHLALIILGVGHGDEVITSSFTFSATVNPIVYQGATPIFVDSEYKTWNMNPELLETAINDRIFRGKLPKAILPVHIYGMPANMDEIISVANHYAIPVIEDAAEAIGSSLNKRKVGSIGKMGVLSFNGNKIITTSGGGALLSNDEELILKARFLSTQAREKAIHYEHSQIGYNYRLSNILAGIGRGQLEVLDQRIRKRRENFHFYKEKLMRFNGITLLEEPDKSYFSNHWLTTILVNPELFGIEREDLQIEMLKENIETRPLWKPMHLQPVFSSFPSYLNGTSESLFKNGLCLPSGSNLSDCDLERVIDAFIHCVSKNKKTLFSK